MSTPNIQPTHAKQTATIPHTTRTVTITHTHKQLNYLEALPLVMPALLFVSGFLLNKLLESTKEKKRLKVVEKLFYSVTSTLIRNIKSQSQAIADKIPNIESLDSSDLIVPLATSLRTERLRAIPDTDLYKLFVEGKADSETANKFLDGIAGGIDFINDFKQRIALINDEFYKYINTFIKEHFAKYWKLLDASNQLVISSRASQITIDKETDQILKLISRHKNVYVESKRKSIYAMHSLFVKPLLEDVSDIDENKMNYEMLTIINELATDYDALKLYAATIITQLQSLKNNLDLVQTEMTNSVAHFKAH